MLPPIQLVSLLSVSLRPSEQLADEKSLDLSHVRHFVVDECDKCLENIDMRADVQVRGSTVPKGCLRLLVCCCSNGWIACLLAVDCFLAVLPIRTIC